MLTTTAKTNIGRIESTITVTDTLDVQLNLESTAPDARARLTIKLSELEGIVATARDLRRRVAPEKEVGQQTKSRTRPKTKSKR